MAKAPYSRWLPGVSCGTLAALLLTAPVAAGAQGFAGTASVFHGSAAISVTGGVQTVSIPTTSPVTTINWTPTDTASSSSVNGAPINFLPIGQTVSYVGAAAATVPYTVLNRIIPNDPTRTVAFNGTVNSTPNTRVWFYSPGGLLIGQTANFYVGGLVLTAADPVTDPNGNFITTSGGIDNFSVAAAAGSTSAITIQPGANIEALNSGQSNYIVAIAPQISQGGVINVAGSVALVAAESATFAVDSQGLFNISVTSGTTVSTNTFVHSGSTGGPNVDPSGSYQRVYMVAVPKNNAISMAIASSGSIGFAVADAANLDGDAIVLSAGSNIADITTGGSGNPVVAGRAGSGTASLTVGGGNYTSNSYAVSTDTATITDPALSIGFASDLTVVAPQATVNAQTGTISVGGDLLVNADNSVDGSTKSALVEVQSGATLAVGANAAALGVNGALIETADDALAGVGGTAILSANSGSITVNGNALVSASGLWGGAVNNGYTSTQGGTAQVAINGGSLSLGGSLTVTATADATGANAALVSPGYDAGVSATGGNASVTVNGVSATIDAVNGIATNANAISDVDGYGNGGTATGGNALIEAQSGATLAVGLNGGIAATANAVPSNVVPTSLTSTGGPSIGGTAQVIADGGTITIAGVFGITVSANAIGGTALTSSGSGGNATGGIALVSAQGDAFGNIGSIATNTSGSTTGAEIGTQVEAFATGGNAAGSYTPYQGGNAQGGTATIAAIGANQSITIDQGSEVYIDALANGGAGAGGGGGAATGGSAQLLASGGAIAITNTSLTLYASATGGSDSSGSSIGNGGNAAGGSVRLSASGGGTIDANISTYANAAATGGSGSGNGGNALGGNIFIDLGNNAFNFDSVGQAPELDASSTAGTSYYNFGTPGTAASAGGVRVTDLGTVTLGGALTIDNNTPLYVQADGSIAVTGSITGTGAGAYLHLWADDLGSGTGTVTLPNAALDLPGNNIDIYYNPTSLGTPTDFSSGVSSGIWTGYQLVDNVDQLQLVGSYLSQNFALGKNIDASATAGWNGGAGFVPIGTYGNGFTGNFDGLNHTITNLYINTQNIEGVGLFGIIGAGVGANLILRNVGVVNAEVTGYADVGALVGGAGLLGRNPDNLVISNSYSSGGAVSGATLVGGLVGQIASGPAGALNNVHSDAAVFLIGGGSSGAGGLVGASESTTITNAYATGSVTGTSAGDTFIGGLIGLQSNGSLSHVYATGPVVAPSGTDVGGLIGNLYGTLTQAYSVGAVTAGAGSSSVGGLVGSNNGSISESWTSSAVVATGGTAVGGFVGQNSPSGTVPNTGTITNSYWDTYSTGQGNGVGTDAGTTTNLNPVTSDPTQTGASNYAFYPYTYGNFPTADWVYDNGSTRPVGAWEVPVAFFGVAPVASAHQVQLIDFNLGGSYTITQNIDMSGTADTTDIWGPGGFMPLGLVNLDPPFTGTLEGAGHVLSNLTMAPGFGYFNVGLFQQNSGTISDLGLYNVNITSAYASYPMTYVGAIAGINAGTITDSFTTGTITLTGSASTYGVAGGLVGLNSAGASITQSYASVAVSGGQAVGGLVGDNEGAISGSYANGAVSGSLAGGLVGESFNSVGPVITNSYWDTDLSGQSSGCGSGYCGGATGLTTAQTLLASSFTGFAIDTTGGRGLPWRQYEGLTTPLLEAFLTPITVQPGSLTKQYNAQAPTVPTTNYGAQPSFLFGTPQIAGLTQNAGTTYLTYSGGLYSNQLGYDLVPSTTPGTLVITPASLAITYAANAATSIYGDTISGLSGSTSALGLQGSDTLASVTSGTASFTTAATGQTSVGSYAVTGSGLAGYSNNYSFSFTQAAGNATALTITPRPITVTANPQRQQVWGPSPVFTYVVTGSVVNGTTVPITPALVNGDQLTGQLTSTATPTSPPGYYDIVQGTLAASANYQLTYVGNILTLVSATNPFGDIGNVIETNLAAQTGTGTTSPAGTCDIHQGSLAGFGNCQLTYADILTLVSATIPFGDIGNQSEANLPDQSGTTPEERRKQEADELAALYPSLGLHPQQITQSMINDQLVTTPPPVNEPVTSNGNSSLWSPGAP